MAASDLVSFEELGLSITSEDDSVSALEKLLEGKADYMIMGRYRAKVKAIERGVDEQLNFLQLGEFTRRNYIGFAKGSEWEAVIPQLDKLMKGYTESGYRDHLNKNYLMVWYGRNDCSQAGRGSQ